MADTTRENLYTAPESSGETSGDTMRSVVVQWTLWMGAAAVTASLLTVTWSVLRKPRIDNPEICVVLLIIFTIQISRRRSFLSAICLCQAVNMTVWLAMLISLLLALPIISPNIELTYSTFEWVAPTWLVGVVIAAVIAGLTRLYEFVFRVDDTSPSPTH